MSTDNKQNLRANKLHLNLILVIYSSDLNHGLGTFLYPCPAFVGALEQAASYMSSITVLQRVIGGEETWGEEGDLGSRWTTLLSSGAVDGRELRGAWQLMQQEARESALYLGEEVEGVLRDDVEGAGQD